MQWAKGVSSAQGGSFHHVVIGSAKQAILPKSKLVPRDELPAAGHTSETLNMIHLRASSHDEVVLAEADVAFCAFYSI